MWAATYPQGSRSYPESKSHRAQVWIRPISPLCNPLHLAQHSSCCVSGWSTSAAWRHLLLLLYLSKPLPGNLGHIQAPPATTDKMLFHVNLICIPTLNLFQLCHPYVYQGRKSKEWGKQLSVFSQIITPLILTFISCWLPPTPPKVFSKPSSYFLLLFTCFRSLLRLKTHPRKWFPFVKTSDLKQQQTAWHLLIHQHFCCCFINDSGWNSDLLGWLMAEPHGKWTDNDLGEQRHTVIRRGHMGLMGGI